MRLPEPDPGTWAPLLENTAGRDLQEGLMCLPRGGTAYFCSVSTVSSKI